MKYSARALSALNMPGYEITGGAMAASPFPAIRCDYDILREDGTVVGLALQTSLVDRLNALETLWDSLRALRVTDSSASIEVLKKISDAYNAAVETLGAQDAETTA